jgi:hypothetical protein
MVMQEEGHGSTGAKGVSPGVCIVESEGFLVSEVSAGVSDEIEEEFAGNRHSLSSNMKCIQGCAVGVLGDALSDPCNKGVRLTDWAENGVTSALLCADVHFFAILLFDKSDGHILGVGDFAVS